MSKTAVIVIHYGNVANTKKALKSLSKKIDNHTFILINNTSDDLTDLIKIIPDTSLIVNKSNIGFASAVNQGITLSLTNKDVDSVFILNNDTEFAFGNINILRKTLFLSKSIGIVAPVLRNDSEFDWGGRYSKWKGNVRHSNFPNRPKKPLTVDHVSGAAMLIKRTLIEEIGPFDETFFMYFEDVDYCLRARQNGYRIIIDPEVVIDHKISSSSPNHTKALSLWRSHLKFIFKQMPRNTYPTAILYDLLVYPLLFYRSLLLQLLHR